VTAVHVLRERGKSAVGRCGEIRGSHHPFIGLGERRRGVDGGSNGGVNGFNAIEDGVRLRGGLRGRGNDGGASNGSAGIRGWSWAARGGQRR
jgi:hypothetical protein